MARFIALDKTANRPHGWTPASSYAFSATTTVTPVLLEEVPHAVPSLPLVFTPQEQAGSFELMALLSLQPDLNLMTTPDGRWLGSYVPASLRRYPFKLVQQGKANLVCFDIDSGLLREDPGAGDRRFFDEQGEPSADLARTISFLEKCELSRQNTQRAVDALAKYELIQPWEVKVDKGNGVIQAVQGLYRIDEQALAALNGRALSDLKKRNALMLAYGHLLSQHRVANFAKLYELREKLQPQAVAADAIDPFFDDGGTLNLDFLNH